MSSFSFAWFFDQQNSVAVGAYGLLLGIVGTVLTVIGLTITYIQARKAASAARAATQAVSEFKVRSSQHDAFRDIAEIRYALETAKRFINGGSWRDASDAYEDARRGFVRISVSTPAVPPILAAGLAQTINQMTKLCDKMDAAIVGKASPVESQKVMSVIRRHYELLTQIQQHIEGSVQ